MVGGMKIFWIFISGALLTEQLASSAPLDAITEVAARKLNYNLLGIPVFLALPISEIILLLGIACVKVAIVARLMSLVRDYFDRKKLIDELEAEWKGKLEEAWINWRRKLHAAATSNKKQQNIPQLDPNMPYPLQMHPQWHLLVQQAMLNSQVQSATVPVTNNVEQKGLMCKILKIC